MKTADLIVALAADAPVTPPAPVTRSILLACAVGAAVALAALVAWLGLRPLGEAILARAFWMKAGYTATLGVAGLLLVARLARPAGRVGRLSVILGAAVAVMITLSALEMARTPPGHMRGLWMGQTWAVCSLRIVVLAAPVYAAAIWALRRLAPTRLALAGGAAGLLAGAVGATVYGLYCQESAATFVVTWYTLGVAVAAGLGALIGSHLLRW